MVIARSYAVGLVGVEGHVVEVEADLANGLPAFTIVGLPDTALAEARDRVRAAIVNSGETWPGRRLTLGLSPASLPKRGSGFDLAMAVAIVAAAGAVPASGLAGTVFHGELGLDGRVRPVRGVLPAVLAAALAGHRTVVVPAGNAAEAALVPDVRVVPAATLGGVLSRLRGEPVLEPLPAPAPDPQPAPVADLADVVGQGSARLALELAAAGGHHLFLHGPPGSGKTMLAERLPGLLPELDRASALEVTAIHSLAGALPAGCPLLSRAPFRAPHHTASVAAVAGGGSGLARPGAVSLAHRGVLFLDEAPEFASAVLETLRQPLESGEVMIARSGGTTCYPARFQLVLAANPCPCAATGRGEDVCTCTPMARRRYRGRLSGPLLDRVDLVQTVAPVSRADLLEDGRGEPTAAVAGRVAAARARAVRRLRGTPWRTNAEVPGPELRRRWPLPAEVVAPLWHEFSRGRLSARGADRVLRVAWTCADLAGRDRPAAIDVATAVAARTGATL